MQQKSGNWPPLTLRGRILALFVRHAVNAFRYRPVLPDLFDVIFLATLRR